MKKFFEQYGGVALGILALLVLIPMITPVGNIIKTSLQGTATKFSSSMNGQLDDAMNATATAQEEAQLQSKNPYRKQVMSVQKLYDVGERNLTDDDIVTVNGIDCYILQADDTKAELITKDMYNARFDTGGHTSIEVENHIGTYTGTYNSYTDKTYDYKYSTLRTWMNDFYVNKLGADSRILPTTVAYYTKDTYDTNLDNYVAGTMANEYVFALDAKEAKQYSSKFGWNNSNRQINNDDSLSAFFSTSFWTTAGFRYGDGGSNTWEIAFNGNFLRTYVDEIYTAARPAFWISLE